MGYGGKIPSLNNAIREALPHMQDAAAENPNAEVMVRAVKFSSGASWHMGSPVPIEQFQWDDLEANGATDMGKALQLVAEQLDQAKIPQRALPPVLVLISGSKPTDDVNVGLRALMDQPWGRKAVRVAVAVGDDADLTVLQRFIGHPELEPLQANNAESLVKFIKWVSTREEIAMKCVSTRGEIAMPKLPGGPLARRPLHFIWIADCSGSMGYDGKIQALNYAIRNAIPAMQDVAKENPNAEVMIRAVKFSSGASWHVANPVPVDQFRWDDLEANGVTDMGKALQLVAAQLDQTIVPQQALRPVLVLISDGQPTDDVNAGLRDLMAQPWGKKAVRIAIAIGGDSDKSVLQRFISHPELEPLQANNAPSLVRFIKWVSTSVLKETSSPQSQGPNPEKYPDQDPDQDPDSDFPPLPDSNGPNRDDW